MCTWAEKVSLPGYVYVHFPGAQTHSVKWALICHSAGSIPIFIYRVLKLVIQLIILLESLPRHQWGINQSVSPVRCSRDDGD